MDKSSLSADARFELFSCAAFEDAGCKKLQVRHQFCGVTLLVHARGGFLHDGILLAAQSQVDDLNERGRSLYLDGE